MTVRISSKLFLILFLIVLSCSKQNVRGPEDHQPPEDLSELPIQDLQFQSNETLKRKIQTFKQKLKAAEKTGKLSPEGWKLHDELLEEYRKRKQFNQGCVGSFSENKNNWI